MRREQHGWPAVAHERRLYHQLRVQTAHACITMRALLSNFSLNRVVGMQSYLPRSCFMHASAIVCGRKRATPNLKNQETQWPFCYSCIFRALPRLCYSRLDLQHHAAICRLVSLAGSKPEKISPFGNTSTASLYVSYWTRMHAMLTRS
jgi:hypothetical protein